MKRLPRDLKFVCLMAVLMLVSCGSPKGVPKVGYGRSSGQEYATSLNGNRTFKRLLTSIYDRVDRYTKLSPRWEKYSTVIWMPDYHAPPRQEVVDKIEEWMANGWERSFVYIGRDFDAEKFYWQHLADTTTDKVKRVEYKRRGAKSYARVARRPYYFNESNEFF